MGWGEAWRLKIISRQEKIAVGFWGLGLGFLKDSYTKVLVVLQVR